MDWARIESALRAAEEADWGGYCIVSEHEKCRGRCSCSCHAAAMAEVWDDRSARVAKALAVCWLCGGPGDHRIDSEGPGVYDPVLMAPGWWY